MRRLVLRGPRGLHLRCRVAERRRDRVAGLIGLDGLDGDEALLIPRTTSVHTFGMRFPILVARLDASLRVVDVRRLARRRLLLPARWVRHVLECSVDLDLRPGDRLIADLSRAARGRGRTPASTRP